MIQTSEVVVCEVCSENGWLEERYIRWLLYVSSQPSEDHPSELCKSCVVSICFLCIRNVDYSPQLRLTCIVALAPLAVRWVVFVCAGSFDACLDFLVCLLFCSWKCHVGSLASPIRLATQVLFARMCSLVVSKLHLMHHELHLLFLMCFHDLDPKHLALHHNSLSLLHPKYCPDSTAVR